MSSDPFYAPGYFEFQEELLMLESDDPREHEQGVALLAEKADAGNTDAMAVLGRHFYNGKYRDVYAALKWYIRAAQGKNVEGQSRVARLYVAPEDEETVQAIRRLEVEGYDRDRVFRLCGIQSKK